MITDEMVEAAAVAIFMRGWPCPDFMTPDAFLALRKYNAAVQWEITLHDARAAIAAVAPMIAAGEREACANTCADLRPENGDDATDDWIDGTNACAAAIRARATK